LNATKSGTSVSITGSISAATQSAAGTLSAADKKKLDGISEDSNKVEYSQTQTSGTKIGTITIDGTPTNIYVPTLSGGEAEKADTNVISGVTVDDHTVTVAKKSINGSDGISTSGTIDAITIKHNTKGGTDVTTTAGKAVTSLTIDDYGHVTATGTSNIINSVTVSGTGNAITGGSVTNGAVTLTKGASFDTAGSANAALTSAKSYTDNAKTEVMTGIENIQTSLN